MDKKDRQPLVAGAEPHSFGKTGKLKIFVGAAPGCGKTFKMLREAHDLQKAGFRVVIGFIERHQRKETMAQIGDLKLIPLKEVRFQNRSFAEMDSDRIVTEHPDVVIVDELAHTNMPGSKYPKRYMDILFLLNRGIDVLTTVNVQHLEAAYQEAEKMTQTKIREVVPQYFVDRSDEIEVVDVPPEILRQRLRDGKIFPRTDINQALNHYFKTTNLSRLRELTLRTVGDTIDSQFQKSYERRMIPGPIGVKEIIMVCTSYLQRSAILIRKGFRMAQRIKAELLIVTILDMPEQCLSQEDRGRIDKLRSLASFCHARYLTEQCNERPISRMILKCAEKYGVTQIVIGQTRTSGYSFFRKPNLVNDLLLHMKYVDLHIVGWKQGKRPYRIKTRSLLMKHGNQAPKRGRLTVYVGSSPGVGKTYRMLRDANEWADKGIDVVVGLVETHGRKETEAQIGRLPVLPRRIVRQEGRDYEELDIDAVLRRHPEVVLIDELAHSNAPGSRHKKRYMDITELLNAGINVVTAVNIQHLESLRDIVAHVTGVKVMERVPDHFMDLADQIYLIDVTPALLQNRLKQGKIYARDRIEQALNHFFRLSNLSVLRELALFEAADNIDQQPDHWETVILTCVSDRPHSEKLIRRGWRLADRYHAHLYVLTVLTEEQGTKNLENLEQLSEQFRATFLQKRATEKKIGAVIVRTAAQLQAAQIVVGQPLRRRGFGSRFKPNPVLYVMEHAEFVNLHVVANSRGDGHEFSNES